jgi:hypothetical protein
MGHSMFRVRQQDVIAALAPPLDGVPYLRGDRRGGGMTSPRGAGQVLKEWQSSPRFQNPPRSTRRTSTSGWRSPYPNLTAAPDRSRAPPRNSFISNSIATRSGSAWMFSARSHRQRTRQRTASRPIHRSFSEFHFPRTNAGYSGQPRRIGQQPLIYRKARDQTEPNIRPREAMPKRIMHRQIRHRPQLVRHDQRRVDAQNERPRLPAQSVHHVITS